MIAETLSAGAPPLAGSGEVDDYSCMDERGDEGTSPRTGIASTGDGSKAGTGEGYGRVPFALHPRGSAQPSLMR